MNKKALIIGAIVFILLFGLIALLRSPAAPSENNDATADSHEPGELDAFAACLKDAGVKFYGAFWCSHCQAQKALFGNSVHLLPYIECSTPDARDQTAICKAEKIEGYPTWVFPDGTRADGEQTLEYLSEKSSCPLPGAEMATTTPSTASTTTIAQ